MGTTTFPVSTLVDGNAFHANLIPFISSQNPLLNIVSEFVWSDYGDMKNDYKIVNIYGGFFIIIIILFFLLCFVCSFSRFCFVGIFKIILLSF